MQPANIDWHDLESDCPIPVAVYFSGQHNSEPTTVPWADVYLCKVTKRKDSLMLSRDTILVLDTNCMKGIEPKRLSDYWLEIGKLAKFNKCRVTLSREVFINIKKYKYQYGQVTWVTDD